MKLSKLGNSILEIIAPYLSTTDDEHVESIATSCLVAYFEKYMISKDIKNYSDAIKGYEKNGREWYRPDHMWGVVSEYAAQVSSLAQSLSFVEEAVAEQVWSKYDISWVSVDKYFALYQSHIDLEKIMGRSGNGLQPPRLEERVVKDIANDILKILIAQNYPHLIIEKLEKNKDSYSLGFFSPTGASLTTGSVNRDNNILTSRFERS